jgi:hypothetical protein
MIDDDNIDKICEQIREGVSTMTALQQHGIDDTLWADILLSSQYGVEPEMFYVQQIRQAEATQQAELEKQMFKQAKGYTKQLKSVKIVKDGEDNIKSVTEIVDEKHVHSDRAATVLIEKSLESKPQIVRNRVKVESLVSDFLKSLGYTTVEEEATKTMPKAINPIKDAEIIEE